MKKKDNTNERISKLILIEKLNWKFGIYHCGWCGNIKKIINNNVKKGQLTCGCFKSGQKAKHHKSYSSEYNVYRGMIKRCYREKEKGYERYGGRGIKVCDRWLDKEKGFQNFYEDMGPKPTPEYSIERRNNEGNYTPENCYWATKLEQGRNKRNNIIIEYNGKSQTLSDWARELGIKRVTLAKRLLIDKWPIEKAFSKEDYRSKKPIRSRQTLTLNEETHSIIEWAEKLKINPATIRERIKRGWSVEEALTIKAKYNGKNNISL